MQLGGPFERVSPSLTDASGFGPWEGPEHAYHRLDEWKAPDTGLPPPPGPRPTEMSFALARTTLACSPILRRDRMWQAFWPIAAPSGPYC
jgi:hypothetical protein